ncbi:MAG: 16S rRNA (guanine(966)-N(2))-methyltransferase RsmD [Eubacteriales bacterium]|jgi:16S rRNA (guanine966-N2)-methyltransferase
MRIISGSQRGRKLLSLEGQHTRPTSEKVKEALFSIIQFEIEGRRVLDLFAGSGQLGLEALSRGARECVFVDNDRNAMQIIRQNAEKCGFTSMSRFLQNDYSTVLKRTGEKFDIILIDPPYASSYYHNSLKLLSTFDILAQNGIIIFESESDMELPESVGTIQRVKEYKYGRTKLTVYRNKTADD